MRAVTTGLIAVAVLLLHGVAAAAPQVPTDPVAKDELKQGYELAQASKCGEAIPHLQESLRLDPKPITLINLADCEEKVGKLADAMTHWTDARTRATTDGEKAIADEASARAGALEGRMPHLTLSLSKHAPPDAVVERDGVALGAPSLGVPLPVDPGTHVVVVHAPGHEDLTKTITMAEGDKQTLDLTVGPATTAKPAAMPAAPPPEPKRSLSPLVPIGFGVGAAGLVVGAITGILTLGKGSDASDHCKNGVCDSKAAYDDVQSGKTLGAVSTAAFILGGAGVALGVVGLFTGTKSEKEPAAPTADLDVRFGPTNFALHGRF